MNKLTNILLSLGVLLFLLSFGMKSEAVATCPTGYSSKTINMNVGGCTYTFDLCYRCSPLGQGATKVEFGSWPTLINPGCVPTIPMSTVVDYILSQIQSPAFIFSELCVYNPNIPPCGGPQPPSLVTFKLPQCWQAEVVMYFGQKTVHFLACTEDYCEVTYAICVDNNGHYVKTQSGPAIGGNPSCTTEAWQITNFPDPNDLTNYPLNEPTDCYKYHTPCDL